MFGEPKIPESKIETSTLQSIDNITFEQTLDDEGAIQVSSSKDSSSIELLEKAKKIIRDKYWWLQEKWQEKGIPREQISITVEGNSFELYNYGDEMTPEQIQELQKALHTLSQIPGDKPKYIVIDSEQEHNEQNNEDGRGYAHREEQMIRLFPRAMSSEPHRIPETSGFIGTLIHEFGHFLQQNPTFQNEWIKKFGWKWMGKRDGDPSVQSLKRFETDQEDRCVSDYAKFSQDEDICESLVAAITNPSVLDAERLQFIQDKWLKNMKPLQEDGLHIKRKMSDEIELPKIPTIVKYKIKKHTFNIEN